MTTGDERHAVAELERLRAYFDGATSGIFVYSPDGKLVDVNLAACRMHGYARDEMLAMDPRDFIAPESHHVFAAFAETVLKGERYKGEAQGVRKDGTRFDVEVAGELMEVAGEQLLFSSLIDVSERNILEAQLRHSQQLEAVGQLAGGVAHDFNNLLLVILGYTGFLRAGIDDEALLDDVEIIHSAAKRAETLVGRLLAFSRRQPLEVQPVDIGSFVDELRLVITRVLPESIHVAVDLSDAPCVADADRAQVEQMLLNLSVNAHHAMPTGGTLTLAVDTAAALPAPEVERLRERGESVPMGPFVRLRVIDDGAGMSPAVSARAFEPFFTTKAAGKGSGLGLSMVFGTIRQLGGHVVVESELGRGTTFSLFFLQSSQQGQYHADGRSLTPPRGRTGETILVVEDDDDVRKLTGRLLRELGYDVHEATGRQEAVAVARRVPIDLLLTDVVMPGGSGPAVLDAVHAHQPSVPVVYASGFAEGVLLHHGVAPEGLQLLRKPFDRLALGIAVRTALDKRGHHQTGQA